MLKWFFRASTKAALKPSDRAPPRVTGANAADAARQRPIDTALQHHQAGRLSEAEAVYRAMLAIDPDDIDALHFSGVAAYQRGEHEQAAQLISKALSLNPSNAPAQNNLGNVFGSLGRQDRAIACYRSALALAPDYIDALLNLARAVSAKGDLDDAIACYQKAVALGAGSAEVHFRLANAYKDRGRLGDAIASYRTALGLKPDSFEIYNNLGNALHEQGNSEEAISCLRKVVALKPDFTSAHINLGNVFRNRERLDEAADSYRAAIALEPAFPEAHVALGMTLADQGQRDEALGCFRKALSLDPGHSEARWLHAMCQSLPVYESEPDLARSRAAFASELVELDRWFDEKRVADDSGTVGLLQPFGLAYQEDNNRDLLQRYGNLCARIMAGWRNRQAFAPSTKRHRAGLARIGIVSAQFLDHSVWSAIVRGWFQELDRNRFSLHAFSLGGKVDRETEFARSRAARFEEGRRGVRQWVETIVDEHLDALVYPEIGMSPMAVRLASLRLAPVQVASWGHPETTGLPTIDYFLSAEDLEPADAQANYTERLVALPHLGCFVQASRAEAAVPDVGKWGIDGNAPLLLCPGTPFKYFPQHDWIFPEIARRLGRCRFVFFTHRLGGLSEKLRRRLEAAFTRDRLDFDDFVTFIPWQDRPGFFGLLERADVYLDTIGFSGFNSAMQAVECGLPIVSREGRFLRGRLASGILKRMGLPELVAQSEEDYVALAVRLVRDDEYREHVRERIEASRHVLFSDLAPIRALENFLVRAANRN